MKPIVILSQHFYLFNINTFVCIVLLNVNVCYILECWEFFINEKCVHSRKLLYGSKFPDVDEMIEISEQMYEVMISILHISLIFFKHIFNPEKTMFLLILILLHISGKIFHAHVPLYLHGRWSGQYGEGRQKENAFSQTGHTCLHHSIEKM